MVESVRFVFAPDDWRIPVKSILNVFRIHTKVLNGRSHNIRAGLRFDIEYLDRSLITVAQYIFGIIWIKGEEGTLAAGRICPARTRNPAASQLATGDGNRCIVLLSSINTIRKLIVDVDAVELPGGHIALRAKASSAVES